MGRFTFHCNLLHRVSLLISDTCQSYDWLTWLEHFSICKKGAEYGILKTEYWNWNIENTDWTGLNCTTLTLETRNWPSWKVSETEASSQYWLRCELLTMQAWLMTHFWLLIWLRGGANNSAIGKALVGATTTFSSWCLRHWECNWYVDHWPWTGRTTIWEVVIVLQVTLGRSAFSHHRSVFFRLWDAAFAGPISRRAGRKPAFFFWKAVCRLSWQCILVSFR